MSKNILLTPGKLLNEKGNLNEAGYSLQMVREYNYNDIKAAKIRIKEWDYYYIGNNDYGIALTISSIAYIGLFSVSFLDFKNKKYITKSELSVFPFNKYHFPSNSGDGEVSFENKKLAIKFKTINKERFLTCEYKNYDGDKSIKCDVKLYDEPTDSIVIATPFSKNKHFYYNQKINSLKATGSFSIGDDVYSLDGSLATLDWGRGVWTYINTWYWSSFNAYVDNHLVSFNLGYGFGDTTNASENIIFVDGKGYKVDEVVFNIPQKDGKDSFMEEWTFKSNDGMVDLVFKPIIDRYDNTNVLLIQSKQHQVFGSFYGTLKFGDEKVTLNGEVGFAEKVYNRW